MMIDLFQFIENRWAEIPVIVPVAHLNSDSAFVSDARLEPRLERHRINHLLCAQRKTKTSDPRRIDFRNRRKEVDATRGIEREFPHSRPTGPPPLEFRRPGFRPLHRSFAIV